ncbi:MAG: ROK family transcriptional regulator [Balneolales bacterium]|nr:ROK family transcriptional regulator [Balneolales bacterium]
MFTGTNLTYTKAYNFRIVFEIIRIEGPISRADIARKTNLTAQTVSNIVTRLLERNFILEASKLQKQRGAPSTNLVVNPEGAYSIGIDFNNDHLTGILVDLEGNVKSKYYYDIDTPHPDIAAKLIADTVQQLRNSRITENSYFCGVGVGLPGPLSINQNNQVSNRINPKAFPNWNDVPIGDMLTKAIQSKVFIENNASAAAVGELWYGAGKNNTDFLYVFLGAGLGGGVVLDGNLFEGANRNSGELGYFPFLTNKSPLSTSEEPHIGEHFNLPKLYKWLKGFGIEVNRPEELELLFHDENPHFMEWLQLGKEYLTPVLLSAEYILDLETIILGGRLPGPIIDELAQDLPKMLTEQRIDMKSKAPNVLCGTAGADAAALGAATLPVFDLFSVQKEVLLKNGAD